MLKLRILRIECGDCRMGTTWPVIDFGDDDEGTLRIDFTCKKCGRKVKMTISKVVLKQDEFSKEHDNGKIGSRTKAAS